jgi:hypothetical protein
VVIIPAAARLDRSEPWSFAKLRAILTAVERWRGKPSVWRAIVPGVALAAVAAGVLTAVHYHQLGLTLSHYDARGHLVVARRIFDNITPGWQQIGAVWLPLPHLLNALPVQIDLFYRTGASAVALSILSFAVATGAIAWIVSALTESRVAAVVAAMVFAANPNVLYLQSTPMTEPLLLALTLLGVALLIERAALRGGATSTDVFVADRTSSDSRTRSAGLPASADPPIDPATARHAEAPEERRRQACPSDRTRVAGWVFALACLTRYEAWPVTATALAFAVWACWRHGDALDTAVRRVGRIALYPAVALIAFTIFSRIVVGRWFVSGDFFVPENKALGDPWLAVKQIAWGVRMLSGPLLVAIGLVGLGALLAIGVFSRARGSALVAVSVVAMAAIPLAAFVKGHPYRIRYMVPLIAVEAIGAGAIVGLSRRARGAVAVAVLAAVAFELRPLDASAPMVVEAQWDRPNVPLRAQVTACIGPPQRGMKIMASMGSLGHHMQEMSRAGFAIRDFLHEGNGDLWLTAIDGPYPFAQWILIEEKAQGGDVLARIAREHPHFLVGYRRVCEGAGLALYKRQVGIGE